MPRIGLISDTHGLLRPEALTELQGCDYLIHAGDIGKPEILAALAAIAPLTAVRGNNDHGDWADALAERVELRVEGVGIHVLHDLAELDAPGLSADVQVIVSGHSHKPLIIEREGRLLINPGSAGPRRFSLPVSVAELLIVEGRMSARIVNLVLA
ncbi:metallophosphoesterase family protein [Chitinimonas naiadis]